MFDRVIKLIGEDNFKKLQNKKVLIIGIGGVGGTALEALVRSGIKNITIIDYDTFELSNLNRQILALDIDINQDKVEIAYKRMKSINKEVIITYKKEYLNKDNINNIKDYDYVIDACDSVDTKIALIKYSIDNNINLISCMGTGKKLNPSLLEITTLDKTYNDPLAKKIRHELTGYTLNKVNVVFSKEKSMNNDKVIASMMMVPSAAGLLLAYYVINEIIKKE